MRKLIVKCSQYIPGCTETSERPVNWVCFTQDKKNYYFCPECVQEMYKDGKIEYKKDPDLVRELQEKHLDAPEWKSK